MSEAVSEVVSELLSEVVSEPVLEAMSEPMSKAMSEAMSEAMLIAVPEATHDPDATHDSDATRDSAVPSGPMYAVSACLTGLPCRYDGKSKPVECVRRLVQEGLAVAVCPEQLGGLSTPRPPSGLTWNDSVKLDDESGVLDDVSGVLEDTPIMSDDASNMSDIVSGALVSVADTALERASRRGDIGAAVWRGRAHLINRQGVDVTAQYKLGAQKAYDIARRAGVKKAILKQHSPSCGCGSTGGAEPWQRLQGDGVTAAYFKAQGLEVMSDEEYAQLAVAPTAAAPTDNTASLK